MASPSLCNGQLAAQVLEPKEAWNQYTQSSLSCLVNHWAQEVLLSMIKTVFGLVKLLLFQFLFLRTILKNNLIHRKVNMILSSTPSFPTGQSVVSLLARKLSLGHNQGLSIGSPLVMNIHALPQFPSFSTLHLLFHFRALPSLPLPIWLSSLLEALCSVVVDWTWLVWGDSDTLGEYLWYFEKSFSWGLPNACQDHTRV